MCCWHWNSLKAVHRGPQNSNAGWFKKPTVHRPGHQRLRYFIAQWERFLLIPHGRAFAKTKLPMTHLLLFGGRATISFIHVLPMFESREGLQISQEDALTACSPSAASTDLHLSENFCFAAQICSNHSYGCGKKDTV